MRSAGSGLLGVVMVSAVLTACGPVLKSSRIDLLGEGENPGTCRGEAGTYFLAKGELSFQVNFVEHASPDQTNHFTLTSPTTSYVVINADRRQSYCLDFISNIATADVIQVTRDKSTNLLRKVYSHVEDKSDDIVGDIARGVSVALANSKADRADFADDNGAASHVVRKFIFDPFNEDLLTKVNQSLKATGHCVYLDPAEDPLIPDWMGKQCGGKHHRGAYLEPDPPPPPYAKSYRKKDDIGILYRPLSPHTLVILKRDDPTSGEPWRVLLRKVVDMPNRSPIFSVEVKRGFFTDRTTQIDFADGALVGVRIEKKSELNAVAGSVLNIVALGVQIPAKAVLISTNTAENNAKIIDANTQLLQLYRDIEVRQAALQGAYDGLTPEEKEKANAGGGGFKRSDDLEKELSRQACLDNALLSRPDEAYELCGVPKEN